MQKKKEPEPRGQTGTGEKQNRQKYYRPHLNKSHPKTPPKYDRKLDREILQKYAGQFNGSLIGDLAAQRLRELGNQRGGAE